MNVDMHAHIIVPEVLKEQNPLETWRPRVFRDSESRQKVDHAGKVIGSALREFTDISKILEEQAAAQVDLTVLSPWSSLFNYDFPPDEGVASCKLQNEALARIVQDHPMQVAGMGIVPLQNPLLAAREVETIARDLGFSAIEIGSNVNGIYLGNSALVPFWEAVQEHDLLVFIHPVEGIGGRLMREHYLWNLFGNPSETGLTGADLILSGMMERYPRLQILLAHAGGTLPYIIGRVDRGYEMRQEVCASINRPPSTFLKQFYFDTIAHSSQALEFLVRLVGAGRIMLGSDYPFDMGSNRPADLVGELALSRADRDAITGRTAMQVLHLGEGAHD